MEVVKARLDLPWPYNYKALDLLSIMPAPELVPIVDKLKSLADAPNTMKGAGELKKLAKPLAEKAMGEVKKVEEEEARKKQEAITAMWGGLWANEVGRPGPWRSTGWGGEKWYPWSHILPGVAVQAEMQWAGYAPDGWQSCV